MKKKPYDRSRIVKLLREDLHEAPYYRAKDIGVEQDPEIAKLSMGYEPVEGPEWAGGPFSHPEGGPGWAGYGAGGYGAPVDAALQVLRKAESVGFTLGRDDHREALIKALGGVSLRELQGL